MMRQAGLIIAAVLVFFVASVCLVPQIALHSARVQVKKEWLTAKTGTPEERAFEYAEINSIPKSLPKKIALSNNYTNTIWLNVAGSDFGFPGDRFTRDSDPKRENIELHGARYRILVSSGSGLREWAPLLSFVNETNFFGFSRRAFNTTANDIDRQKDALGVYRCSILLKAKVMMEASGYTDSCIEFDRGDLKGFIMGDPARDKILNIRIYSSAGQKYIDVGVIQEVTQEKHIQFSDIEELIAAIKTREAD